MNDVEWSRWHQLWSKYENPLPNIERKARRMRAAAIASNVVFWTIVAGEFVAGIYGLRGTRATAQLAGLGNLVFITVLSAGFLQAQRGAWRRTMLTPGEWLDWMEERHRRSLALAQLTRWSGVAICTFTSGLVAISTWSQPGRVESQLWAAPVIILTLGLTWQAVPRTRAAAQRAAAEIARWREQLGAGPTTG